MKICGKKSRFIGGMIVIAYLCAKGFVEYTLDESGTNIYDLNRSHHVLSSHSIGMAETPI